MDAVTLDVLDDHPLRDKDDKREMTKFDIDITNSTLGDACIKKLEKNKRILSMYEEEPDDY